MEELFSLGELYISNFIPQDQESSDYQKCEMKLMLEEETGAVRLEKQAPLSSMYGKYWYRSSINQTMRDELKNVVDSILKVVKLKENDIWIDIATNDGIMFEYVPKNVIKIGIDPADDSYKKESEKRANLIIQDFFSKDVYKKSKFGKLKAKIITVIAMFYDLEDPNKFLRDVYDILDDDGLFVMQMSYTPLMIKQMAFDNLCFKPTTIINGIDKKISDINVGDYTLGYDGKMTKVLNVFEREYDGIMYKIKPEYLDYIEPTPEHPLWIVKKNNIQKFEKEWINVENVEIGDYVIIPKNIRKDKNTLIKNNISDNEYIYMKIKDITTELYKGKVFNIETENHTYLTSYAVVHNCHEHVYYYSLFNIKKLLENNNFKIVDCTLNDINGGSFRIFIKKNGYENNFYTQPFRDVANFRIESLLEYEKTLKLDKKETWIDFYNKINDLKEQTYNFIKEEKLKGKSVWCYGASTKGNTTLQYFGLDNTLIDAIAERSVYKWGLKTIGTDIPICSEEEMRKAQPDYLLILPWHFINEFKEREKDYLIKGGRFIVPCPKFDVVSY